MKIDITKRKIKDAVIKLIDECKYPSEVTSRAIANEAGVKLAMINYCFDSREKLIFTVFEEMAYKNFKENTVLNEIISSSISPKEKLRRLHYTICEYILSDYKYTQAVTGYVLLNRDLTKPLNSLQFIMEHYKERKTPDECRIISYELSSIMQLAIFRYKDLKNFCSCDLSKKEDLHKFIDIQIDLFLN